MQCRISKTIKQNKKTLSNKKVEQGKQPKDHLACRERNKSVSRLLEGPEARERPDKTTGREAQQRPGESTRGVAGASVMHACAPRKATHEDYWQKKGGEGRKQGGRGGRGEKGGGGRGENI